MDKEQARKNIDDFIDKRGYTYTVESLLDSYLNYYKEGWYVSHTTKICILHLEDELKILSA